MDEIWTECCGKEKARLILFRMRDEARSNRERWKQTQVLQAWTHKEGMQRTSESSRKKENHNWRSERIFREGN